MSNPIKNGVLCLSLEMVPSSPVEKNPKSTPPAVLREISGGGVTAPPPKVEVDNANHVGKLASDLASTTAHLDQIRSAIRAFHSAKGRYNSQIAAARMFELVGLPAEHPSPRSR